MAGPRQLKGRHVSKYGNRRIDADGHTFDSRAEYAYYLYLRALEQQGDITDLRVHPRYEVVPAFVHGGRKVRAVTYTPDFTYRDDAGQLVVVDVKGGKATQTAVWRLKWTLLKRLLPAAAFEVVE